MVGDDFATPHKSNVDVCHRYKQRAWQNLQLCFNTKKDMEKGMV
jgi:hypothetical protein